MMYLYFDKNKRYIGSAKEKNVIGGKDIQIVECDEQHADYKAESIG